MIGGVGLGSLTQGELAFLVRRGGFHNVDELEGSNVRMAAWRFRGVERGMFGVWVKWEVGRARTAGFGLGGGK